MNTVDTQNAVTVETCPSSNDASKNIRTMVILGSLGDFRKIFYFLNQPNAEIEASLKELSIMYDDSATVCGYVDGDGEPVGKLMCSGKYRDGFDETRDLLRNGRQEEWNCPKCAERVSYPIRQQMCKDVIWGCRLTCGCYTAEDFCGEGCKKFRGGEWDGMIWP